VTASTEGKTCKGPRPDRDSTSRRSTTTRSTAIIDFDAFLKEERASREPVKPVLITIGGKQYPLPQDLPAVIALDIIKLKRSADGKDATASPEALSAIGEAFFGAEVFRQILTENRLGIQDLGNLITESFRAYSEIAATPDPVPNPVAPEEKTSI
jgi:hypothetical protein